MNNHGIKNKMRSYIASLNVYTYELPFIQFSYAQLQILLFQSAFKLHIQFPNITSRHPENRGFHAFRSTVENAGKHAQMLMCTHGIPNITSKSIFIYRCRSRARDICSALSNIPMVYFHAFASAEIPRAYLLF